MTENLNEDGADAFRNAGHTAIQKGNWDEALQNLFEAHQRRPHGPYIRLLLAQALIESQRANEAIAHLEAIAHQEFPEYQSTLKKQLEEKINFYPSGRCESKKISQINKSDIINQLIRQFNLTSYLECNNTSEFFFDEIICQNKFITHIPKADCAKGTQSYLKFTSLAALSAQHLISKFDLIFFDPTHIHAGIDDALQKLPLLLNPDGFLVVNNCNPRSQKITSQEEISDVWLNETYKAFSLFHQYNTQSSFTINEDGGIGVILNHDLILNYPIDFEIIDTNFDARCIQFLNLITYRTFRDRLKERDRLLLARGAMHHQRIVVVLGMHRSGTSALTRGLSCCGIDLGDNLLMPAKDNNPKGFFEDADINSLNVEILASLGLKWDTLRPITSIELADPKLNRFLLQAILLIQEKLGNKLILGLKEPRIARLFSFWQHVFSYINATTDYVLACRNPLSVADSLNKRDNIPHKKSYDLWLQYVVPCFIEAQQSIKIVVDYDLLMANPEKELLRISRHLNLTLESSLLNEYCSDFLDQQLRHTQYTENDVLIDPLLPGSIKQIYPLLLRLAREKTSIQSNKVREQFIRVSKDIK
jgi:hypothetical protein